MYRYDRRFTKEIYNAKVSGSFGRGRPRRIFHDQINNILEKGCFRGTNNRLACMLRVMEVDEAKETKFLKRLLILMLHLLLLSSAVYLRHSSVEADANPNWGLAVEDVRGGVRLATELGTIVSTLCYIILQQGDELKNQGLVAYFKQLVHEPAKLIFLASNLLLLACIPARLCQQTMLEETLLIFLLPGSWFLLMFFAGAVKLTGPFVTMIFSMITGDMFTFGIIYCIVLFGFSQSFFFLYKGFPNVQSTLFSSYPSTWMALFQVTLGDYSYSDLGLTTYPNLAKTVFAIFMVFVPILLLNMLIAMMGNTYAHVIEQSEKEWVKQWAKIVVSLERSVAQEDAHRYLQEYSIGLGPSDDPRYEQRGVMVIKSKAKTRAKQRKGALSNWKRVGKVTIAELRKRGISGEELRRLMWGRASISTPTKHPVRKAAPPEGVLGGTGNDVYAGVGSALSSTLDVMAFTHDLDLRGTDGIQKQQTPDLLINQNIQTQINQPAGTLITQGAPISLRQSLQVPNTLLTQPTHQEINNQTLGLSQNSQMQNMGLTTGLAPNMGYQVNLQMGQNFQQMGQNVPQTGQNLPQMGQNFQQMSLNVPQTGQNLPQMGQNFQQMGQNLPQTGQNVLTNTQMGVARSPMVQSGNQMGQINVQIGHIRPQMGGVNSQMGQQNSQTMQINSQMGQINQQTGRMDQMNAQIGQTNQQMGQMPSQTGRAGIPVNMTQAQSTSGTMQQQPGVTAGSQMPLSAANLQVGAPQTSGYPELQVPYISPELSVTYEDYLHQLIVLSESSNPRPSLMKELAQKAADLDNVPEIDVNVNLGAKSARLMVAGAVSGLFGVASELPTPDSWRRDDTRNHSDSEPISDSVVLGRASRARRARSASRRVAPPPPHLYVPARSMYLVTSESSAVESDSKEDHHASGLHSALCGEEAAKIRAARPHCILHAAGQVPQEHSLYVVGAGHGVDPETGAPERPSKIHERRRERPKTARPRQNKVSPSPPSAERSSPLEPWATAPLSRLSKLIRSSSASTASLISQTSLEESPGMKRY